MTRAWAFSYDSLKKLLHSKTFWVLFAMLATSMMYAQSASADMSTNSRLNYGNAWNYCHIGNAGYAKGMVWLSNNESDYYSEAVNVPTNANSVLVSIRGAVNTCQTPFSAPRDMYAVDVSTGYLSGLGGTSFYRGRVPAQLYAWSTVGSKLYGTLNVSGVATCGSASFATGSSSQTIFIQISRRQQQYSTSGQLTYDSPTVGVETVPVNVTRTCPMFNYTLTPSITGVTDGSALEVPRQNLSVTGTVRNAGATASRSNIDWRLTKLRYDPGAAIPQKAGGVSAQGALPCTYFTGEAACDTVTNGVRSSYARNAVVNHPGTTNVDEYGVGTRICFAMSVRQYTQATENWRHSALSCYVIGKKPKVHVLGGDLIVGRGSATNPGATSNVVTSVSSLASGAAYGSWAEYAIIPSGVVMGMASGSGYAGGAATDDLCQLSVLTFTNAGSATCNAAAIGRYTHATTIPNIAARFPVSSTTSRISGTSANLVGDAMSGLYTTSSPALSITGGGDVPTGRWVVINAPNTDVTITGDIRYTSDPLTSIGSIPQVVIIARNIIVADGVQNIDSWLVAVGSGVNGRINTCGAGGVGEATPLNAGLCASRLTVNGPISANHLIMRRTAGAGIGAAAGEPAEVFNLRADAYIWASSYTPGTGRLPTVNTTELPPRF